MGQYKDIRSEVQIKRGRKYARVDIPRVSLGCHIEGAACPSPDPYDFRTLVGGVCKRVGCKRPPIDRRLLSEFRSFVRSFLRTYIKPLEPGYRFSVHKWLATTNYPVWRRQQILRKWSVAQQYLRPRHLKCNSFVKREAYYHTDLAFKEARTINSRSDAFKAFSGPIFRAIEDEIYKFQPFIKHVPVADRADYVSKLIYQPGARYIATDYTSFEAHFHPKVLEACEIQLYKHMLKYCWNGQNIARVLSRALSGTNTLRFGSLDVQVDGCRMSGDMCTSLGNGFTNYMLMAFTCYKSGVRMVGVVEGDDGLFRVHGRIDESIFERLGFRIKLEYHTSLASAKFCSMVFSDTTRRVMCDPIKKLLNVGWSFSESRFSPKARAELLRAKALSLLCECPGVPICAEFGKYLYRNTSGKARYSGLSGTKDWYENSLDITEDRISQGLSTPVQSADRLLVEKTYGVPVSSQLLIESYFAKCDRIQPIPLWLVKDLLPKNVFRYAAGHVFGVVGRPQLWRR